MNPDYKKTHDEITFYENAEKLTDRELLELQAYYQFQIRKNSLSIRNNVLFFFYLFIVCALIAVMSTIK
jgi:hypothetical protein